jgi:hypothetical protein
MNYLMTTTTFVATLLGDNISVTTQNDNTDVNTRYQQPYMISPEDDLAGIRTVNVMLLFGVVA